MTKSTRYFIPTDFFEEGFDPTSKKEVPPVPKKFLEGNGDTPASGEEIDENEKEEDVGEVSDL